MPGCAPCCSRYLAENGFRVSTAAHAADARDKMRFLAPDALVLDVMMPGETGLALTASLRARTRRRADPAADRARRAGRPHRRLRSGADDYLGKPFEPRELVLRLRAMLRRSATVAAEAPAGPVRLGPLSSTPRAPS